jgi:hypothetical protein
VAVMREPVKQRRGHLRVAEDGGLVLCAHHGSKFSRVGASEIPGAVQ